jgi:hypothetical protein
VTNQPVIWRVRDYDNPNKALVGTSISSTGLLTIGANETSTKLRVTAEVASDNRSIGFATVNVLDPNRTALNLQGLGRGDYIVLDGHGWIIVDLTPNNQYALLLLANRLEGAAYIGQRFSDRTASGRARVMYEGSNSQHLLTMWYTNPNINLTTIKAHAVLPARLDQVRSVPTDRFAHQNPLVFRDVVFLLSSVEATQLTHEGRFINSRWWLRDARNDSSNTSVMYVRVNGNINNTSHSSTGRNLRPAVWVSVTNAK